MRYHVDFTIEGPGFEVVDRCYSETIEDRLAREDADKLAANLNLIEEERDWAEIDAERRNEVALFGDSAPQS